MTTDFVAIWKYLNNSERNTRNKRNTPELLEKTQIEIRDKNATGRNTCCVNFQKRDKKDELRGTNLSKDTAISDDCHAVAYVACENYEYEERIAIMMFDGGMSEGEMVECAENTRRNDMYC